MLNDFLSGKRSCSSKPGVEKVDDGAEGEGARN